MAWLAQEKGSFDKNVLRYLCVLCFRPINVVDNMVKMLEQHAEHLEELVGERTRELNEEKKRTDSLLYSILPK